MMMRSLLTRYTLGVGVAVCLALLVNHYFSFTNQYWLVISALCVNQMTRRTLIRQGLSFFVITFGAIILASILMMNVTFVFLVNLFLGLAFVVIGLYAYINRSRMNKNVILSLLFLIMLLLATKTPATSSEYIQHRFLDLIIGSIIGSSVGLLLRAAKIEQTFEHGVAATLKILDDYLFALCASFLEAGQYSPDLGFKKAQVERALQSQGGPYPDWVYEVGFNRGLRIGYRFFLVNIERIIEIIFALEYVIRRFAGIELPDSMSNCLRLSMLKNQELLVILVDYFTQRKHSNTESDFTSDIKALEKALDGQIPGGLELLDISPERILLTAIVRHIRDLRGILLQLVMALPAPVSSDAKS